MMYAKGKKRNKYNTSFEIGLTYGRKQFGILRFIFSKRKTG